MRVTRSRWVLGGLFTNYEVIYTLRAKPEGDHPVASDLFITSLLDAWLSSPWDTETLYSIYETLGGSRRHGLTTQEHRRQDGSLRRALADAFRRGRLVAREVQRIHPLLLVPEPEPAPEPASFPQEVEESTFIAIQTQDEDGEVLPSVKYRITLPDGSTREGRVSENGYARIEGVTPGTCEVSFPDLEGQTWQLA